MCTSPTLLVCSSKHARAQSRHVLPASLRAPLESKAGARASRASSPASLRALPAPPARRMGRLRAFGAAPQKASEVLVSAAAPAVPEALTFRQSLPQLAQHGLNSSSLHRPLCCCSCELVEGYSPRQSSVQGVMGLTKRPGFRQHAMHAVFTSTDCALPGCWHLLFSVRLQNHRITE